MNHGIHPTKMANEKKQKQKKGNEPNKTNESKKLTNKAQPWTRKISTTQLKTITQLPN